MLKMIHDLDEFLYPAFPDAENIMGHAGAMAAVQDCGLKISVAEAREMINRGVAEQPDWRHYLIEHGVDPDLLHTTYHKRLDHKIITPYPKLSKYFAELGDKASHVVLTHSKGDWATRTVEHLALRPWLPDERILYWEKYKELKGVSRKGFEMAAVVLQSDPRDIHFGDDSLRNIVTAKKEMGMTTVWASHGKPLPAAYSQYVDHIVGNVGIFMQQQIAIMRKAAKASI